MKPKIRVGIIGAGFGARVHVPIIKDHPGFEVISISSVSRSQTEDIKKETGLEKVYSHWIEMLEKEELLRMLFKLLVSLSTERPSPLILY